MALATSSTGWAFEKMHRKGEDGEPVLRPFVMETKFDGGCSTLFCTLTQRLALLMRPAQRLVLQLARGETQAHDSCASFTPSASPHNSCTLLHLLTSSPCAGERIQVHRCEDGSFKYFSRKAIEHGEHTNYK